MLKWDDYGEPIDPDMFTDPDLVAKERGDRQNRQQLKQQSQQPTEVMEKSSVIDKKLEATDKSC